jgi:hypothetical protein
MCCLLVSGFLTEITQQIHSLRASGVISSHFARATGSEIRTFRKSAGTLCTAPGESAFLVMDFILHRYAISLGSPRMPSKLGRREKPILNKCRSARFQMDGDRVYQAQPRPVSWRLIHGLAASLVNIWLGRKPSPLL